MAGNLRLVLEAQDSADGVGYDLLKGKMYDDDYGMFRHALDNFHVCICEPEDPDEEFIITDNGFSVFEGHVIFEQSQVVEWQGNPFSYKAYIEYHKIATISPRLAIILRSNMFRQGNEAYKEEIYRIHEPSPLEDLPVNAATVRYANLEMPDGSIRRVTSLADFEFSMTDSYSMEIHKIPKKHVLIFNRTQIEEAKFGITFCSSKSMAESLTYYLKNSPSPLPLMTIPRYSHLIVLWSAKLRLLHMLDEKRSPGTPGLTLLNPAKAMKSIAAEVENTNYIKLSTRNTLDSFPANSSIAKGSLDMFSWDIHQAQLVEKMRWEIIRITKQMEKQDATAVCRNFSQFLCEYINTRTLLIYLRRNKAMQELKGPGGSKKPNDWLLPTAAEECVFKCLFHPPQGLSTLG